MSVNIIGEDLTIVNQIKPHRRKWAWDLYLTGNKNHWSPTEVSMQKDVEQWKNGVMTDDERLLVKRCLGFFAGAESLVGNNLVLAIFRFITDAECRQFLFRQMAEEAIHNHTIVYVCDSLGLDSKEVYEAYKNIPSIKAKDDFLMGITKDFYKKTFNIKTDEGKQELLRNIVTYYIICEGILFYCGFAMLLSFGRRGLLPGVSEQINLSLRDETGHLQFGINLIHSIKQENPQLWTTEFQNETLNHIKNATKLEMDYVNDVLPNGILGLTPHMFERYIEYIANRRCEQIGLSQPFGRRVNPFNWLSESIDLPKMGNFFEATITSYQKAALVEDW